MLHFVIKIQNTLHLIFLNIQCRYYKYFYCIFYFHFEIFNVKIYKIIPHPIRFICK